MKYVKHSMYFLAAIMLQSLNMVVADVEAIKNYDSELEVGIIYVSEDSFKSGEYTGLEEEGFHGNINFSIISPSAYDSDDEKKIFYEITGTNLGLSSRSIFAEYGELGKYDVYFDYDELPHFQYDDAFSFVGRSV